MAAQYVILDGARRWRAAQLAGIAEVDAIVLRNRPSPTDLRLLQLSIDAYRMNLTPIERGECVAKIKQENNWTVSETAERLQMSQSRVTKLLKFLEACPELRAALETGSIDQDKAYAIISQQPDHAEQRESLANAKDLTREQLRQKARSNGQPVELRAAVARFPLPSGVMVSVQGRKVTLAGAIEAMLEAVKELKKGQADHWDVTTAMRVLRHRAQQAAN